ncbi:MAG: 5-Enolpyruvylshikimate-3-phosphate synthase [Brockia lithotrophica]|uniref:3-phosphoshikimate 1-carboxyvinyltransferase n=1 Tax=Brockia lithotrophica TaxID=933949 RepID=A0A2T5G731_9BACL|nr:MAG: 5-Enolpyruvylshikimate-3-phosphate synthase [Brockia lithotrophica]
MSDPSTALPLRPIRRVRFDGRVPGDKSLSHRILMLGALNRGKVEARGVLASQDVEATLRLVRALGVDVAVVPDTAGVDALAVRLASLGPGRWHEPRHVIDAGNSGTTLRLALGLVAPYPIAVVFDGDDSLARRPMRRVVDPLRRAGAAVLGRADGEYLPLAVRGGNLRPLSVRLPVASAQVKSALLFAGLGTEGEHVVEEPVVSRDHTERLLRALGAPLAVEPGGGDGVRRLVLRGPFVPEGDHRIRVPGDISSAAFFLGLAAAHPDAEVVVREVGLNPTRTGFLDVLRKMGATVEVSEEGEFWGEPVGSVRVASSRLHGVTVGAEDVPRLIDELPLLAVLATQAEGRTVVEGASELRVKESDRIAEIVRLLRPMGAEISERPDGFVVEGPTPLRGSSGDAAGDHRLAMSFAVAAALVREGTSLLRGYEAVAVSFPSFFRLWESLESREG